MSKKELFFQLRRKKIEIFSNFNEVFVLKFQVIKISYLGHRKRLVACLDMLRQKAEHNGYEINKTYQHHNSHHLNLRPNPLDEVNPSALYSMPIHKTVKFAEDYNNSNNNNNVNINNNSNNNNTKKQESNNDSLSELNQTKSKSKPTNSTTSSEQSVDNYGAFTSYTAFQARDEQRSPRPVWKVDPQSLIRGSCNFIVQVNLI